MAKNLCWLGCCAGIKLAGPLYRVPMYIGTGYIELVTVSFLNKYIPHHFTSTDPLQRQQGRTGQGKGRRHAQVSEHSRRDDRRGGRRFAHSVLPHDY